MSITKTTSPTTAPRKARIDMKMVATRDAAAMPIRPNTMARKPRAPAMGCRISVYVRLWRTLELRLTLRMLVTDRPQILLLCTHLLTPAATMS